MTTDLAAPLIQLEPQYVKKEAAAAFLAVSVSTFEELERTDKTFPRARKLGPRRVGYLVTELRAWGHSRPVSDLLPPPNTGSRKGKGRGQATPAAAAAGSSVQPGA